MKRSAWQTGIGEQNMVHVVPIGDLREHFLTQSCWCQPRVDEGVIVHHSLDRREEREPKGEA
jgi:hypothetical protein